MAFLKDKVPRELLERVLELKKGNSYLICWLPNNLSFFIDISE